MARTSESGAYLGGISTMLMQVDVCPACGRVHNDSRIASLLPRSRECPLVVFGSMPTMAQPKSERAKPQTLSVEILSRTDPLVPPLPEPTRAIARKSTGLTVPWPMPSQLEDYL